MNCLNLIDERSLYLRDDFSLRIIIVLISRFILFFLRRFLILLCWNYFEAEVYNLGDLMYLSRL